MTDRTPAFRDVEMPENWFLSSDNACIPYRRRGNGPPLLLIHGWSQSGAMFQHQLAGLSQNHTVIVPDLRGHGQSPSPGGGLRMARLAQDIRELMAHLGLHRADMLGWSMGASVIWAYIDLYGTGAIDRLVLVDQPSSLMKTAGMSEQECIDSGALFTFAQLDELCQALNGEDGETVRAAFVRGMVTPTIPGDLLSWIIEENARTPLAVASALLVSHCMQDWRDVLPRIDRPSLVIGGAASHVDPRSQRFVARQIPGALYHEFTGDEGGAHFPFLEAPDLFNATLASFLQR